jgi:hypothetical protein
MQWLQVGLDFVFVHWPVIFEASAIERLEPTDEKGQKPVNVRENEVAKN